MDANREVEQAPKPSKQVGSCEPHLTQGDVFRLPLVTPQADTIPRILRTPDGQRGEEVFASPKTGRLYSYEQVEVLSRGDVSGSVLPPFADDEREHLEMVVVWAGFAEYFVLASQTCDVSGVDSVPKLYAAILPFVPFGKALSSRILPIGLSREQKDDRTKWRTICSIIAESTDVTFDDIASDFHAITERVRENIPNIENKKIRERVKSYCNGQSATKATYLYWLEAQIEFGLPEGHIDFLNFNTIVTGELERLKDNRIGTIADEYMYDFAQKLGIFLSRVATPKLPSAKKF